MGNSISLGICIPTFNRAKTLKENIINLENVLFGHEVAIYVSDNASTDDTQTVISDLQKEYHNIQYSRNDRNLGADANFEIVLKMCQSRFTWLLGDDDTISGDVSDIIDILTSFDPDVFVMGRNTAIPEGLYEDKHFVFREVLYEMTWMSGLIIKTKIIPELDFKRYSDTYFVHTGAIMDLFLTKSLHIYYKSGSRMRQLRKHTGYERSGLEIYGRGWTDLVMRLPQFSYEDKIVYLKDRTRRYGMLNNRILLSQRGYGEYNPAMLKKYYPYIKLYNDSPYFVLFLLSIFPVGIIGSLRKLYRKIFMQGQPERVDDY